MPKLYFGLLGLMTWGYLKGQISANAQKKSGVFRYILRWQLCAIFANLQLHMLFWSFLGTSHVHKKRERAHDQLTKVNQLSFNNTNPRIIWVLLPDIIFRMYSNVVYRKLSLVSEWLHIVNDAPIMRASCPPPFCMTCWHATALCRVGEWTSSSLPDGSQKGHVKYYTCSHRVHPCVF